MKILVPTKRVPDSGHRLRLCDEGTRVDLSGAAFEINPFDAIALEEALLIRERRPETEVVAVAIGSEDAQDELRTALAMGADRACLVETEDELDSWNVARVLQAVVEREAAGLVLMGKQAVDDDAGQAGQFLAARLEWPQATFASQLEFLDDGRLSVERETDDGREVVRTRLPAVVTVDLRLNEPRYASMAGILQARRKTIEQIGLEVLGVTPEPRVRIVGLEVTATERQCRMAADVQELLGQLRDEAGVL